VGDAFALLFKIHFIAGAAALLASLAYFGITAKWLAFRRSLSHALLYIAPIPLFIVEFIFICANNNCLRGYEPSATLTAQDFLGGGLMLLPVACFWFLQGRLLIQSRCRAQA
jgi:hypothetical protein